ncbi:MAG: transposase, partial [Acidimicrobiia bacterium]|nr:transposase [Acidimicrobiia bacterium]
IVRWGDALLEADIDRFGQVEAVGVDETLFWRKGRWRKKQWCTSVVDVGGRQLSDIVPGRTADSAASWFRNQPTEWCEAIRWAVLDLSGPYQVAYDRVLPHAHFRWPTRSMWSGWRTAVWTWCDAGSRTRPSMHRGRKGDPLYRIRRLLIMASERLDVRGEKRIQGLLRAGDPYGEARDAWYAKESIRDIYQIGDAQLASEFTHRLSGDLQDRSLPREVNSLGRTIARWATQITNWHHSAVTNGPTEGLNNLIKRIKRAAFGFRSFANYRIRALLTPGNPTGTYSPPSLPANFRCAYYSRHLMLQPVWPLITPDPCKRREDAEGMSMAAAEATIRQSPFEWERWGKLWKTRSHPMLPCDLLAGSRSHLDGWWPNLMLAAGHRGAEAYWQFDTYQGNNQHIPMELIPEAINRMVRVYVMSAESAIWELDATPIVAEVTG